MILTRAGKAFLTQAALAACFACSVAQAAPPAPAKPAPPANSSRSGYPRVLGGEELLRRHQTEQVDTEAEHAGSRFRLTFFPDGRLACVNVKGGGSVAGRWSAEVAEGLLCLNWKGSPWPASGCYRAVATGPYAMRLEEPGTGQPVYWFLTLNAEPQ